MGLGDDRRRALRIRIRNILWKLAPKPSEVAVGMATEAILEAIGRDPLGTLADCPVPNCSCWLCLLRLQAEVAWHQAHLRVEREAEQEVD